MSRTRSESDDAWNSSSRNKGFIAQFGIFDRLKQQPEPIKASIYTDPDELEENFAAITVQGVPSPTRPNVFFWQYHTLFLNALQGLLKFDEAILKQIVESRRIVTKNQLVYVFLRRTTLLLFLLFSLFSMPSSLGSALSSDTIGIDWSKALPGLSFENNQVIIWQLTVVIIWLGMLLLNGVIKSVYDSSIEQTTSNLSSDLQDYTQQLYLKGFKSAMDNINDEEASYGNDNDTSVWPERAKKWSRIAYWHGKRIEWLSRYTSIEVWMMQRRLRIMDHISRIISFLILIGYIFVAKPQELSSEVAGWSIFSIGAISLMAFLGWDRLGKENTDPLGASLLGPERQRWFQSVDVAGEFAMQVFKDKARIQRKVRTRESGGE